MPSSRGLARARALAKTADKDYAKHKRAAEASVATWQWCSQQMTSHEPGFFESSNIGRGKKVPSKPTKPRYHQAHEGFDAAGRLVVMRQYRASWDDVAETFHAVEPDAIVSVRYGAPRHWGSVVIYTTDKRGRVTTIDSVFNEGYRTRIYRFDPNGYYAGFDEDGTYQGKPVPHAFDFECDATGRIVRAWWLWPSLPGRAPDLYWEHSSVKGKKPAKKPATKPAKKPAKPARTR